MAVQDNFGGRYCGSQIIKKNRIIKIPKSVCAKCASNKFHERSRLVMDYKTSIPYYGTKSTYSQATMLLSTVRSSKGINITDFQEYLSLSISTNAGYRTGICTCLINNSYFVI
ncbi:hypothetical protein D6B99_03400 [Arachidicoccus soli]|uniref:Uncharacterized protein n=1 Tax=Arachidicoccus soli TaxID=2341117 RepID=A0A386HM99_9BACT|nr:hypothetical protein D6B99_03400 [Arachidicoccus soli]